LVRHSLGSKVVWWQRLRLCNVAPHAGSRVVSCRDGCWRRTAAALKLLGTGAVVLARNSAVAAMCHDVAVLSCAVCYAVVCCAVLSRTTWTPTSPPRASSPMCATCLTCGTWWWTCKVGRRRGGVEDLTPLSCTHTQSYKQEAAQLSQSVGSTGPHTRGAAGAGVGERVLLFEVIATDHAPMSSTWS